MPPWRFPRTPSSEYEYLFDGDQHQLEPGYNIGSIPAFRARLSRMCQAKGLRYRSVIHEGRLYVEVFRVKPGDLYLETYPEDVDAPPEPWPAQ